MNLKKIVLTTLLSSVIALPAIATEIDQSNDTTPALEDHNTLQAESSARTSGTCWIYIPGLGWIYVC